MSISTICSRFCSLLGLAALLCSAWQEANSPVAGVRGNPFGPAFCNGRADRISATFE